MYSFLLLSPVLAAGCLLAPTQKPAAAIPATASDPFPQPTAGITITVSPKEDMKLEKLVDEFSRVTGITILADADAKPALKNGTTGLNRSVEVPLGEVYSFVESVLVQNDLILVVLHDHEPRLFALHSLAQGGGQRGGTMRDAALYVSSKDIALYGQHPAILVTTMIDMPHTDVRTISNSMRTMFTNANTQQIIPVGNSNSLILTGFGTAVAGWVRMLQEVDDVAKREMADDEKRRAPPPGQAPAKEEKPKQ